MYTCLFHVINFINKQLMIIATNHIQMSSISQAIHQTQKTIISARRKEPSWFKSKLQKQPEIWKFWENPPTLTESSSMRTATRIPRQKHSLRCFFADLDFCQNPPSWTMSQRLWVSTNCSKGELHIVGSIALRKWFFANSKSNDNALWGSWKMGSKRANFDNLFLCQFWSKISKILHIAPLTPQLPK